MATDAGLPNRLTTDEVALVLRRATELEALTTGIDPAGGFDAAVVIDAAEEVGLSPIAVRQALAELQTGALQAEQYRARGYVTRLAGPSAVVESRVVSCPPEQVLEAADAFLRRRSFELRRRQGQWTIYRERQDLWRHLRRMADVIDGAGQLAGVHTVTVALSPLTDGGSVVRVAATLQQRRRGTLGIATGYMVVAAAGTIAVAAGDPAALLVGTPIGAAIGVSGLGRRRRWRRRRSEEVSDVLATMLDGLD